MRARSEVGAREFLAFTLREIAALNEAAAMREAREDLQLARIVAMISATNSKNRKYDPTKWMFAHTRELLERPHRAALAERRGMTGEEIMAGFRRMGIPIIDKRTKK